MSRARLECILLGGGYGQSWITRISCGGELPLVMIHKGVFGVSCFSWASILELNSTRFTSSTVDFHISTAYLADAPSCLGGERERLRYCSVPIPPEVDVLPWPAELPPHVQDRGIHLLQEYPYGGAYGMVRIELPVVCVVRRMAVSRASYSAETLEDSCYSFNCYSPRGWC